jgi:protease-4
VSRLLACVLLAELSAACIHIDIGGGGRGDFEETVVFGNRGPKVLLLEIEGVISERERSGFLGAGQESTVARVVEQLDVARDAGDIRAVILRVDSPGGSAAASDDVYRALRSFKDETGLPVLAQFMGLATSGGYYVAMAADEIYAVPTCVTGSIGVLFVSVSFEGLMTRLGVRDQTLTGGKHKDAASVLRDMTPDERSHLQSVVDDLHDRFKSVVEAGRPKLDRARVDELADGSVYSAPQAEASGLVDGIAPIESTVARAAELAGLDGDYRVVTYHRPSEFRNNLYTRGPVSAPTARTDGEWAALMDRAGIRAQSEPGFHYLWWPAAP